MSRKSIEKSFEKINPGSGVQSRAQFRRKSTLTETLFSFYVPTERAHKKIESHELKSEI